VSLFDRCRAYTEPAKVKAAGVYPYFHPIQEATPTRVRIRGEWKIMVGSNNYLGLTHHPRVLEASRAALLRYGSGSTGSRLLNGTLDLHEALEARLAAFLGKEAALVFTTGYLANLATLPALCGPGDHIVMDRLNHACLLDGARLSGARLHRFPHGDSETLQRILESLPPDGGRLLAVDGVFSMEGDLAPLPELVPVARAHGAQILVDDAHGLGVLGPGGAGTVAHFGLTDEVDLIMATFSKSLASVGGVLAGPEEVITYLKHHARAFVFTAAMPPGSVAGVLAALDVLQDEPERRRRLRKATDRMQEGLRGLGFDTGASRTPIIPVLFGDQERTLRAWRVLFDHGVMAHPVVPPAVPVGTCRLRISLTAEHTDEDVDRVLQAFQSLIPLRERAGTEAVESA